MENKGLLSGELDSYDGSDYLEAKTRVLCFLAPPCSKNIQVMAVRTQLFSRSNVPSNRMPLYLIIHKKTKQRITTGIVPIMTAERNPKNAK